MSKFTKTAETDRRIVMDNFALTSSSVFSGIISFIIFLLVTVFPLIYHNSYFDILETKYQCYYRCIVAMVVLCVVMGLVIMLIDMKEYQGEHVKDFFERFMWGNWKNPFFIADAAVLVFWLVAVVSTCQSDWVYESFWGNEGRYTGLFLLTLYMISYFLISRCWQVKGWFLDIFLISGMIMCLLGITDYFQLDILRFRVHIKPEQSTLFVSTVGNINTYTAYIALVMGYSAAMFAAAKNKWKMIWYYVCMVISFMAIIMGCSDNAYLALGALFAFLPFILFQTWRGILRYLIMTASFFSVAQCIDWINHTYEDMVVGLDSLFRIISDFSGLPLIVAGLWIIVVGFYIYLAKDSKMNSDAGKIPVRIWTVFIASSIAVVCFMLIDANMLGNGERYGALRTYLVFNDSWGTKRGYIWRKSLELYRDFEGKHKVFGYGPDTFGILTTKEIRAEMVRATGQVFDNVHNEYLQLFLTIGPIGMLAYVTFVVAAIVRFCKNLEKHDCVIGCCMAVLAYSAQALVNLNLPIATPMMWLLLSIGMAACRSVE